MNVFFFFFNVLGCLLQQTNFILFPQYVDKGSILICFKFSQKDICNLYYNILTACQTIDEFWKEIYTSKIVFDDSIFSFTYFCYTKQIISSEKNSTFLKTM
jgi:hypothetical protein